VGSRACEPAFRRAYHFDERFIDKSACRPTRRQDCPPHIGADKWRYFRDDVRAVSHTRLNKLGMPRIERRFKNGSFYRCSSAFISGPNGFLLRRSVNSRR
jgi:hypothetical protein